MPPKIKKTIFPITKLINGDDLNIYSLSINSGLPGPSVYLQANLHGPEVLGSAVIGKILKKLEKTNFVGKIILVPSCNPMGVLNISYNSTLGRWNQQNGNNWNRIFNDPSQFSSREEKARYYQNKLNQNYISIENRLAAYLLQLSAKADYIVDLHTTGYHSKVHIFTHSKHSQYFESLADIHLLQESEPNVSAFDERSVANYSQTNFNLAPITCTLECGNHSNFTRHQLDQQVENLWLWLQQAWSGKFQTKKIEKYQAKNCSALYSTQSGYLNWLIEIGEKVKKGNIFAEYFNSKTFEWSEQKAEFDFTLLSKYGSNAVSIGNEIGWIAVTTPF